ncbi:CLUMA_CG017520, isoform A [Clunio marinus]|uniref:CLUMA_CG017520, isoform A n=1 Tax=Clunio marinus TaxID=568069 RepID=A0A1J1IVY2_9DIPT|nr:CLUMA_CG017520, isoform A [Clunio marinus]
MADREDILANFQEISGISDIEVAICHLESTGWNLQAAVNSALEETSHFGDINMLDNPSDVSIIESTKTLHNEAGPSCSSSKNNTDELIFNVHFNNRSHQIHISSLKTIKDLKEAIFAKTSVPLCRQLIEGLQTSKEAQIIDTTVLRTLNVSRENNIFLTDISNEGFSDDVVIVSDDPLPMYQLRISYVNPFNTSENKELNLNFPASKTILDIKNDIHAVLKVPVRHQNWVGWPESSSNSTKLSETGFNAVHLLQLTRIDTENNFDRDVPLEIDSDSSVEEFEDALNADEDIFAEPVPQNRLKYLIDDHTEDEILGCLQFITNYRDRYGHGPNFFEGTLDDAVKAACSTKSAKDRKLLAIYLHHDRSVLSNVFCGQLLNNENIIKQLNDNYIIYGWDLTCESNKNMFLSSLTACVADSASLQIRGTPINQLPIIMIIRKYRATCEVADIIHGNINSDELFIHLMMNSDAFNEQMKIEIREEYERMQREVLLKEQQQAYQESLEADRAKEEAKLQKEKMMATERRRQESERAEIEARKEAEKKHAESLLPPEPDSNCTDPITKIRFRKPTGDYLERRFIVDNKLKVLLNFATANGFSPEEFKIISSFPRRDLTLLDPEETLKSLKLYPQETVILEER